MTATFDSVLKGETSPGLFVWRGSAGRDLEAEAESGGWGTLVLETRAAISMADVYDVVTEAWSLPDWFGRNLDALWDSLLDLTEAPTVLIWSGASTFAKAQPDAAVTLVALLRDAVEQADALVVVVVDEPGSSLLSGLDGLL